MALLHGNMSMFFPTSLLNCQPDDLEKYRPLILPEGESVGQAG